MKMNKKRTKKNNTKSTSASTNKKNNPLNIWLAIIPIVIAIIAFLFQEYPWLKFSGNNYEERAKAGHTYSQVYYAELMYSNGNYDDALYWYKIASTKKGGYGAIASNNLGVLYANGYGLKEIATNEDERLAQSFMCFYTASEYGLEIATYNAVNLLRYRYYSISEYIDEDVVDAFLNKHNKADLEKEAFIVGYRYESYYAFLGAVYKGGTYCGANVEYGEDGKTKTVHVYKMPVYNTEELKTEYQLILLSD